MGSLSDNPHDNSHKGHLRESTDLDVSQPLSIPVVEETVSIRARPVERSRVRIEKKVMTEDVARDVLLHSTRVDVRRVPCNRPVDEPPPIRVEGDVTIIPVVEEVVEIKKSLILKEELHITRKEESRKETVHTNVRREQVHVERLHPRGQNDPSNEPLNEGEIE
ncbi:MAG: YsnF/AvaK domain-containing protein [Bdellovibrionales bacterium]